MKKKIIIHIENNCCGVFYILRPVFFLEIENIKKEILNEYFPHNGFLGKIMQWLDYNNNKKIIRHITLFQEKIKNNNNNEVLLYLHDYHETTILLIYRIIENLLEKQQCQIQCNKCSMPVDFKDIEKKQWSNIEGPVSGVGGTYLLCPRKHLLYKKYEWIS